MIASQVPFDIDVYEASHTPGSGMPYSASCNSPDMLCNAFSREIPSLTEPFIHWVKRQGPAFLEARGLSEEKFDARSFYPRTLLGAYFAAQVAEFRAIAERAGRTLRVHAGCRIDDIAPVGRGYRIEGKSGRMPFTSHANHVIIATGHVWPEQPEFKGTTLMSPWPASNIEALPPVRVGIIGSSLSAIDVALALAAAQGTFEETGQGARWLAHDGAETLRITMLSREGVMPEPDFFYPFPHAPLAHLNAEAVAREVSAGSDGLLDRVFALLCADLKAEATGFIASVAKDTDDLDAFAASYFKRRAVPDGLSALRDAMKISRASFEKKEPIPHRHVLLRASEALNPAVRSFSEDDFRRFSLHLRPVLADAYAAVPHRSVDRILGLHEAGVLDLRATGDAADLQTEENGPITAQLGGETLVFDVVVDARGQSSASLDQLPFPTLVSRLAVSRPVEAPFRLNLAGEDGGSHAYCLAMPQLLERHPFAQGLADCAALSRIVVRDLLGRMRHELHEHRSAGRPWDPSTQLAAQRKVPSTKWESFT
jgi:uncharacterized NAD(P)/FAD-binding protein YdhS